MGFSPILRRISSSPTGLLFELYLACFSSTIYINNCMPPRGSPGAKVTGAIWRILREQEREQSADMLENIDLNQTVEKAVYKERMKELSERLFFAQKSAWSAGIPVIILFEGWDAAGKGTTIQKLTKPIDPRGYKIYPIRAARTYEKKRPWLYRFWLKTPARGEWSIFDRSWYGRVLVERMRELITKDEWERAYQDIVDFERMLADDGALIIKFFLHISKKEQKKRFKKLSDDPLNAWRVTKEDRWNHKHYDEWLFLYEEMMARTESEWGPWTVVEATDKRHTSIKVYETIINALEDRLGDLSAAATEEEEKAVQEGNARKEQVVKASDLKAEAARAGAGNMAADQAAAKNAQPNKSPSAEKVKSDSAPDDSQKSASPPNAN